MDKFSSDLLTLQREYTLLQRVIFDMVTYAYDNERMCPGVICYKFSDNDNNIFARALRRKIMELKQAQKTTDKKPCYPCNCCNKTP